jgi:transcription elongation factor GreA
MSIPMTVRGAILLREELHRLKSVERPSVINAISEARAQGDLSENAESKLSNAQVIDPKSLDVDDRIVFGATVDLEEQESGKKVTYQLVGEDEADVDNHLISITSPIARALIGRSEGDIAVVQAPSGAREYEVLAIRYL